MNALIDIAGWTLVQFVWQGAAIAAAAVVALRLLRRRPAAVTYAVACLALAAMLAAPVATALSLSRGPSAIARATTTPPREQAVAPASIRAMLRIPAPPLRTLRPVAAMEDWLPLIVGGWTTGVFLLSLRLAGGWWRIRALQKASLAAPPSPWQATCDRLAARLGIRRAVHVVESLLADAPAVAGWLRPVIVLPVAALTALTPAQVEAILAHELAHVRRHDYIVNLLQTMVETLFFYHPCVWWMSARVRTEREHCCDEVVLQVCGDAVGYAEALTEIESRRAGAHALALAATGGSLVDRIRRILAMPSVPERSGSNLVAILAVVSLTLMFVAGAAGFVHVPNAWRLARATATPALSAQRTPPAPPAPPTPPAAPAAPTPPTPSAAAFDIAGERNVQMRSSDALRSLDVRGRGAMTFTDDLTDVQTMEDGAYLTLRERHLLMVRSVEIRFERGAIARKYYEAGAEQAWEPAGRQWLAERLPSLVRRSGLAAESRTRRILAVRGVEGVFEEIGRLESDFARRLYFQELFKAVRLDAAAAARAMTLAGQSIHSDFELRQTLASAAPFVASDAAAGGAYAAATTTIASDFERRQALDALVNVSGGAAGAMDAIVRSVAEIGSDFEKRQTLSNILRRNPAFDVAPKNAVLGVAATIGSDFEAATLLIEFAGAYGVEPDVAAAYFTAVGRVRSDFEKGRVLKSVARRPVPVAVMRDVLDAVGDMGSDFEQAEVLLSVVRAQPIDAAVRPAFIDAADGIHSEFEQNRVLAALTRAERR
jgi:beta-lactamase regulating signal transducer with metallopeptidase domain